jgi:hypothetical protein
LAAWKPTSLSRSHGGLKGRGASSTGAWTLLAGTGASLKERAAPFAAPWAAPAFTSVPQRGHQGARLPSGSVGKIYAHFGHSADIGRIPFTNGSIVLQRHESIGQVGWRRNSHRQVSLQKSVATRAHLCQNTHIVRSARRWPAGGTSSFQQSGQKCQSAVFPPSSKG